MALRIATIGRNGQVARALAAAATNDPAVELIQAATNEADLRDPASLNAFIDTAKPHVLINTGAYNFVDRAESERETAFAINADGPRVLAQACGRLGIPFVHMSTDCVFDGAKPTAYDEDDEPNPLSAYGQSKLAGELAVEAEYPDALTTRVCWVFSGHGENFVSKMIGFARTRPQLTVVDDQTGPPTYAPDIARALLQIAHDKHDGGAGLSGLLHLAAPDVMDRASMARAIMAESARQGGPTAEIQPVSTASFAAPAPRPANAQLCGVRATRLLDLAWTPWPEALQQSVAMVLSRI
jgi:dTDP-4-dehydrorhamnose reductase